MSLTSCGCHWISLLSPVVVGHELLLGGHCVACLGWEVWLRRSHCWLLLWKLHWSLRLVLLSHFLLQSVLLLLWILLGILIANLVLLDELFRGGHEVRLSVCLLLHVRLILLH